MIAALNLDDASARAAALAEVASDAGPAAPLIELRRAAVLTEAGETEDALAVLDAVAASPDADQVYRDLATLKAIILRGSDMDQGQRMAALEALSNPGAPFRAVRNGTARGGAVGCWRYRGSAGSIVVAAAGTRRQRCHAQPDAASDPGARRYAARRRTVAFDAVTCTMVPEIFGG